MEKISPQPPIIETEGARFYQFGKIRIRVTSNEPSAEAMADFNQELNRYARKALTT